MMSDNPLLSNFDAVLPRASSSSSLPAPERSPTKSAHFTQSSMINQIEKLRRLVKERDIENLKLKHDNLTLRQNERKYHKDLLEIESLNDDAPRIIRGLRSEINALKIKLKEYYAHLTSDSRQIRQLNKELLRHKEQIVKYEKVIFARGLEERESLSKHLEEAKARADEQERIATEAIHRAELIDKNYAGENRQLRSKISGLLHENEIFKDKAHELEHTLKEKEKEIASLSIYRFNAIHRKVEQSCKVCAKRERDDHEHKRRKEILEKLPVIPEPMLNIVSATSIDICVTIPQQVKKQTSPSRPTTKQLKDPLDQSNSSQSPALTSPPIAAAAADALESSPAATAAAAAGSPLVDESAASPGTATNVDMSSLTTASPITVSTAKEIQYSGIIVRCSTDASFSHIIEEAILLTPGTNPTKKMLAAAADHTIQVEHLLQDEIYKSETSEDDEPSMRVVSFKNLESGKMYYFDVFATFENIQGAHTTPPEGIFVDMPPLQPPKPMVKLVTGSAREFEVRFPAVVSMNGESAIRRFHIYHANEPTMNERFLIGEIDPVVELTQAIEKDELIFAYKDPQPLINHYFQISSVNALGEGPRSEVSDVYFIDTVPLQPSKPNVKRASASSVRVNCFVPNNGASEVIKYQINVFNMSVESKGANEVAGVPPHMDILASVGEEQSSTDNTITSHELSYLVEGLDPGTTYRLQVIAINATGSSQPSVYSEEVDLERMIPTPSKVPQFSVLAPDCVTFTFNDFEENEELGPHIEGVRVKGRKIYSSFEPDMHNSIIEVDLVPITDLEISLQGLTRGQQYFFTIAYVGESQNEGPMSAPIFVPLAAALELPETPSVSQESASSFDENQLPLKAKSPMENGSGSVRNSKNSLKSGSNLSLDQKVINMHNGMPAHHDDIVNGSNNAAPGGGANGLAAAGSDFKRRSNMRLDQDDAAAGTTAAETPPLKEKLPKEATQSKSRVGKDVKGVVTNARKLGAAAASKSRPPLPNHPHPSKVSPRKQ